MPPWAVEAAVRVFVTDLVTVELRRAGVAVAIAHSTRALGRARRWGPRADVSRTFDRNALPWGLLDLEIGHRAVTRR